jgi:hypothetical protein
MTAHTTSSTTPAATYQERRRGSPAPTHTTTATGAAMANSRMENPNTPIAIVPARSAHRGQPRQSIAATPSARQSHLGRKRGDVSHEG